ncbi:MAG: tRNA lysidine(34) synthetase TilS [Gammaproteobacteria bacterium]|nr:MAG: tRNA lysidine(34) synthetase TilS [Gammaproteobacteria bacterium]
MYKVFFSAAALHDVLRRYPAPRRYWVAYSGGLDSHVLLHAMAQLRPECGVTVHAAHVDHALHPDSAHWAGHCRTVCADLGIPCQTVRVHAKAGPGVSPEAAARRARYQALADLMEPGDYLLTAHHQDDQAETLLLQLLRGAGPHGLAAMPPCAGFSQGRHVRPLLEFSRAALRRYAGEHTLHWIEDPGNINRDFARNTLRHDIMPEINARWPAAAVTLARGARLQAEAAELMDALAGLDLRQVLGAHKNTLSVTRLNALSGARQRNILRYWIKGLGLPLPDSRHVQRIVRDVLSARPDAVPCVHWRGAEVRRYRDELYAMPPLPAHDASQIIAWDMKQPLILPSGLGTLSCAPDAGGGLKQASCRDALVTVRFRRGGERCKPAGRRETHELKKLLQEADVPPWQRARVPLVYIDGQLAAVAGLWLCAPFQAETGEPGLRISLS